MTTSPSKRAKFPPDHNKTMSQLEKQTATAVAVAGMWDGEMKNKVGMLEVVRDACPKNGKILLTQSSNTSNFKEYEDYENVSNFPDSESESESESDSYSSDNESDEDRL